MIGRSVVPGTTGNTRNEVVPKTCSPIGTGTREQLVPEGHAAALRGMLRNPTATGADVPVTRPGTGNVPAAEPGAAADGCVACGELRPIMLEVTGDDGAVSWLCSVCWRGAR